MTLMNVIAPAGRAKDDDQPAYEPHHKVYPQKVRGVFRRTKWVSINGAGVAPQYQGLGGNALLYSEMDKALNDYQFIHGELTQVAETAVQMRKDLINVGGRAYKNHRVYQIHI